MLDGNVVGAGKINYLVKSEYYETKDPHIIPMQFLGSGCASLGVKAGKATVEEYKNLMMGLSGKGRKLHRNAKSPDRRFGVDYTYSVPKSLSIYFAQGTLEQKMEMQICLREAFEKMLSVAESEYARTRRGSKGARLERPKGLTAALAVHIASRPVVVEGKEHVDPQLHGHLIVMNSCQRQDGTYGSVDYSEMFKNKSVLNQVIENEFYSRVRTRMGLNLIKSNKTDAFGRENSIYTSVEVAGIDQDTRRLFSRRSEQLERYALLHGVGKDRAAVASRMAKRDGQEPLLSDVQPQWTAQIAAIQAEGKLLPGFNQNEKHVAVIDDDDAILSRLTESDAVFERHHALVAFMAQYAGTLDAAESLKRAEERVEELCRSSRIVLTNNGDRDLYTTDLFLIKEREVIEWTEDGLSKPFGISASAIDDEIDRFEEAKGFKLGEEQRVGVRHMLGNGQFLVLDGRAGTGKTTCARIVSDVWKREKYGRVFGVATGWDQANKLSVDAGIEAFSLAKIRQQVDCGAVVLKSNDLIIVDESAMMTTNDIHWLMAKSREVGCKTLFQGDSRQQAAVGAGQAHRLIEEVAGAKHTLANIRRQKSQKDVETSNYAYSDPSKAIRNLHENEQFVFVKHKNWINRSIAKRFVEDERSPDKKLIIVATNADRLSINHSVRQALKRKAVLQGEELVFAGKRGDGSSEERVSVCAGDRVRFTKRDTAFGVVNGTTGMVQEVRGQRVRIAYTSMVQGKAQEREEWVDTRKYKNLINAWAVTTFASQGQTVGKTWVKGFGNISNEQGLVQITRHTDELEVVGTEETIAEWSKNFQISKEKANASDAMEESEIEKIVKRAYERLTSSNIVKKNVVDVNAVEDVHVHVHKKEA